MKGMGKTLLCIKEGGLEDLAQTGCRVLNRLGQREIYNQGSSIRCSGHDFSCFQKGVLGCNQVDATLT